MNPSFVEVTLDSFIFAMEIFSTDPARKCGISDTKHEASMCLLNFMKKIQ